MNGVLVDTNVAFKKRWPSYRVTTIVRFHCMYVINKLCGDNTYHFDVYTM